MSKKAKDIDIKNCSYYFFDDIINIKNFDRNNIKIDEMFNKNTLIYWICIKGLKYIKINSVNPLYFIFSKVNEYLEEINKNNHLTIVPTSENKEKIKKYEEIWSKIRDLIGSITKNSDDYDK